MSEWAGFEYYQPDPTLGEFSAVHWNDELEAPFTKIASLIREHL